MTTCSRCNRRLERAPAVESGGLVLGRVCAKKLGIALGAKSKPKPRPAAAPRGWTQLNLLSPTA